MTLIWRIIFLLTSLAAQLPNASASPIYNKEGGIHRRNDPSDDEFEVYRKAANILKELKNYNAPSVASKRRLSQLGNPMEDSDEESIEFPHHPKRRRIAPESEAAARLKTTGLDKSNALNDEDAVTLMDHDDESVTQLKTRGNY